MTSLDWGHYSPGSDDAFPTPLKMEPIVVIMFPLLTAAFVRFFATAFDATTDFALASGLTFAVPKSNATLVLPLTATSMFPSALINRGAIPPIRLITKPSTTVVFAKPVKKLLYRGFQPYPVLRKIAYKLVEHVFHWFGYESQVIRFVDRESATPTLLDLQIIEKLLPTEPPDTPGYA
jgi:hypothetical protein